MVIHLPAALHRHPWQAKPLKINGTSVPTDAFLARAARGAQRKVTQKTTPTATQTRASASLSARSQVM
jgi:hypothetical protein